MGGLNSGITTSPILLSTVSRSRAVVGTAGGIWDGRRSVPQRALHPANFDVQRLRADHHNHAVTGRRPLVGKTEAVRPPEHATRGSFLEDAGHPIGPVHPEYFVHLIPPGIPPHHRDRILIRQTRSTSPLFPFDEYVPFAVHAPLDAGQQSVTREANRANKTQRVVKHGKALIPRSCSRMESPHPKTLPGRLYSCGPRPERPTTTTVIREKYTRRSSPSLPSETRTVVGLSSRKPLMAVNAPGSGVGAASSVSSSETLTTAGRQADSAATASTGSRIRALIAIVHLICESRASCDTGFNSDEPPAR